MKKLFHLPILVILMFFVIAIEWLPVISLVILPCAALPLVIGTVPLWASLIVCVLFIVCKIYAILSE